MIRLLIGLEFNSGQLDKQVWFLGEGVVFNLVIFNSVVIQM